ANNPDKYAPDPVPQGSDGARSRAASSAARRAAPPAHPIPEWQLQAMATGSPAAPAPAPAAFSPSAQPVSASSALSVPLLSPSAQGRPTQEQQSSFKAKWESLTGAAREKLAKLSERFKKEKQHGEGGQYREMDEFAPSSSGGGSGGGKRGPLLRAPSSSGDS